MLEQRYIEIGPVFIEYPDENTELFQLSVNAEEVLRYHKKFEAYEWLESNIPNLDLNEIEYDGSIWTLRTLDIEIILTTIAAIRDLANPEFQESFPSLEFDTWRQEFIDAINTRPLPQEWGNGDVFIIPLSDKTFSVGQVFDRNTHLMSLFEYRSEHKDLSREVLQTLKPISLLRNLNVRNLNERKWIVLFNEPLTDFSEFMRDLNYKYATDRRFGNLDELAEAYWGITFWNRHYHDDHYDQLLLPNVSRPDTARLLSLEEKKKYWKEVLKSDYPYVEQVKKKWWW